MRKKYMKEKGLNIKTIKTNMRTSLTKIKKISVDMTQRLQKSFGTPVLQQVELHFDGKPMTFNYTGPIETVSIDVVEQEEQELLSLEDKEGNKGKRKIEKEELEVKFDPTKRRMDTANVTISCSCGFTHSTKVPTVATSDKKKMISDIAKKNKEMYKNHYEVEGHKLNVDYIEIPTEVIPESERIKNFSESRINYYKLFPTKTTEVKYLVTYGQDILAEAPQYPYTATEEGSKSIIRQNLYFMLFIFALVELVTYIAASAPSSSYYSPVVAPHPNNTPWYILIIVVIIMVTLMWRLHIRDLARSTVKFVMIQPAPFYINNRGVLPVIMTNTRINPIWEYQSRMMHLGAKDARDIFYSLQTWSDSSLAQLYRANQLGDSEKSLMEAANDIRDLAKINYEFRTQTQPEPYNIKVIVISVSLTIIGYTLGLYMLGIV